MAHRNILAALALIALGLGYGYMTLQLPERAVPNTPGPSFFPWIVTVSLLALSAALLAQGVLRRGRRGGAGARSDSRSRMWLVLGAFAIYLVALPSVGFLGATIPFFAALAALYGQRRPLWLAIAAITIPVFLFFLFRDVFNIVLPHGVVEAMIR